MPIHDWTRVTAGIFHDFHHAWIEEIKRALNAGLLPSDYYALAEQALIPSRTRFIATTEMDEYALKKSMVAVRHSSGDRCIALVEVVSPGNKASRNSLQAFVEQAASALARGYHLLFLDLHPPGLCDREGIHGARWDNFADGSYRQPADKPLTLAAYVAGPPITAYIEPISVGACLPTMPLFLGSDVYIAMPLEATYQAAFNGVPGRWRRVLEATA